MKNNLKDYLIREDVFKNITSFTKVDRGGSGALLFDVVDNGQAYIVKMTGKDLYDNDKIAEQCLNEYNFYSISNNFNLSFLPKVKYVDRDNPIGTIIVLKRYRHIQRQEWTLARQLQAFNIGAKLHSLSDKLISAYGLTYKPSIFDESDINNSYADWISVLDEYNNLFDTNLIRNIKNEMRSILEYFSKQPHCFIHGDFYPDNFLLDENDSLILCDWQDYKIGNKSDVGFFINIGYAWGIDIKEQEIIKHYCTQLSLYTKTSFEVEDLMKEYHASNVIVNFIHWAQYLKHSKYDKVLQVYTTMQKSFEYLHMD
jgi:serine/threonine protein kinase